MAVEIIWDKERGRGISLKMNSAILGMCLAVAAYVLDGMFHIGVEGVSKTKLVTACFLLAVIYVSGKLEDIASDRRDKFTCILKGLFCSTAFAIAYWHLFIVRGAPGVGIFLSIFVFIWRFLAARYSNQDEIPNKN